MIENENSRNEGSHIVKTIIFYVFIVILPLILLSPSLKKDWALLDDAIMTTYSIRGVNAILEALDFTELYTPTNQAGSRFHPGFYLYRGILAKIIGLNPFVNHLWQFSLLYLHIFFLHIIIYILTRSYLSSALGIVLYLFYAQGDWSTSYYNWYSLMTFEPIILTLFILSAFSFHFSNVFSGKKFISVILLVLSALFLGFAYFTKEIAFVFTGVPFTVFLLCLKRRFNTFEWKKSRAFWWFMGSLFFVVLYLAIYIILKSAGEGVSDPEYYNLTPGHILKQVPPLLFLLFQNYNLLLLIFPSIFILRLIIMFKEKRNPGRIEVTQLLLLVLGTLWFCILIPWSMKLERLLLITVWCFGGFAALECYAQADFLFCEKNRIERTSVKFTVVFHASLLVFLLYFVTGRLFLPVKIYALILKIISLAFGILVTGGLLESLLRRGRVNRLLFGFIAVIMFFSFLLFIFIGSIGAYNFNHKYDGIEGVVVRMVRKVAKEAGPDACIYLDLPTDHTYVREMNFRLPLFDNRPDMQTFHLIPSPGRVFNRGDFIIHHPWMSQEKNFPHFEYDGELEKIERVHIKHPKIHGATLGHIKKWIIAHVTFPRDPRVKLLEKKYHQNWWEPYVVESETLKIIGE